MERSSQPDTLELSDYLAVVRRRWASVALAGILGLAAAAAYSLLGPKTYVAAASVFVSGSTGRATQVVNGRTAGLINLDTEAQIVQSESVATLARQMLHSPESTAALAKNVSVTVPPNSQVLKISCSRGKAGLAASCAHAFAEAYLQNRSNAALAAITIQLADLEQRVSSLQQKITKLTTRIKSLPHGSGPRISAATELSLYKDQLATLSGHVASLTAQSTNTSGGRIITDAVPPSGASSPRLALFAPSGLAAGLLAGLVVAFRRDRSDKRVRGGHDLEVSLDLPVLLELPGTKRRPRPALAEPRARSGQAFAELAHSLVSTLGQGNHVVLVASAAAGTAGSLAAANLATALTRTGAEVALVCADLRGSITPQLFGLAAGPGLSDVVLDRATVSDAEQRPSQIPRLRIIAPGSDGELAADHIEREVIERLISRLHAVARYVIFEVTAAAYSADVYPLAQLSDAALVAVDLMRTRRDDVGETVRRLDRMGAPVLGAVLLPPVDNAKVPAGGAAAQPGERGDDHRRRAGGRVGANGDGTLEEHPVHPLRSGEGRGARPPGAAGEQGPSGRRRAREAESNAAAAVQSRPLRPLSASEAEPPAGLRMPSHGDNHYTETPAPPDQDG